MAAVRYGLQEIQQGQREDARIQVSIVDVEKVAQVQNASCSGLACLFDHSQTMTSRDRGRFTRNPKQSPDAA
jgi:hypothetical protein